MYSELGAPLCLGRSAAPHLRGVSADVGASTVEQILLMLTLVMLTCLDVIQWFEHSLRGLRPRGRVARIGKLRSCHGLSIVCLAPALGTGLPDLQFICCIVMWKGRAKLHSVMWPLALMFGMVACAFESPRCVRAQASASGPKGRPKPVHRGNLQCSRNTCCH